MHGAVFPPCYLTWCQTLVEVTKILTTFFKRSHARTATLSAPNPAAGHHRPTPPPETPGHSQASLGQSLEGSLLLSPGSWCTQVSVCALQESVSQVLCKFWWLYSGVNGDLLQKVFPGGSDSKASAYNEGDPGLIPGLGRSPGEGNGNPLQYPCLENPMDRGAW